MMRRYILLFSVAILSANAYGQTEDQLRSALKMYGLSLPDHSGRQLKVAPDSVTRWESHGGAFETCSTFVYKYADRGRTIVSELTIIKKIPGGPSSTRKDVVFYTHDFSRIDSIQVFKAFKDDEELQHTDTKILKYDNKNNIEEYVEVKVENGSEYRDILKRTYNSKGQAVATIRYLTSYPPPSYYTGPIQATVRSQMEYDNDGALISYRWQRAPLEFFDPLQHGISIYAYSDLLWFGKYEDNVINDGLERWLNYLSPYNLLPNNPVQVDLKSQPLQSTSNTINPQGVLIGSIKSFWEFKDGVGTKYVPTLNENETDTIYKPSYHYLINEEDQLTAFFRVGNFGIYVINTFNYNEWGYTNSRWGFSPVDWWNKEQIDMETDNLDRLTRIEYSFLSSANGPSNHRIIYEFFNSDSTTSTTDQPVKAPLHIFPNPAAEYIHIDIPHPAHIHLDLFNAAGTIVLTSQWQHTGGIHRIDIDRLPAGVYLARARSEGETRTATFVKN